MACRKIYRTTTSAAQCCFAILVAELLCARTTAFVVQPLSTAHALRPSISQRLVQPLKIQVRVSSACRTKTHMQLSDVDPNEIEKAFESYDSKKTGQLGPAELDKVLDDLGYTAAEKQDVFFVLDVDGDGSVTKEEFCRNMRATASEKEFYRRLFVYLQTQKASGKLNEDSKQKPGIVNSLVSMEEFKQATAAAGEKPVVVEFFAPWCRKCAALKPKYKHLARGYDDRVIFADISVEDKEIKARLKELGVQQIPTFQVWKAGKMVDQYVAGNSLPAVPKAVAEMVDRHIAPSFSLVNELSNMDFDAIDADGSGIITRGEFMVAMEERGWSPDKIEQTFNEMDYNSDGGISRQEFEVFCKQTSSAAGA